jgi:hypothetical protein
VITTITANIEDDEATKDEDEDNDDGELDEYEFI